MVGRLLESGLRATDRSLVAVMVYCGWMTAFSDEAEVTDMHLTLLTLRSNVTKG
jgi:hypothetical protein